jgi:acyl carrier protein phosphodiesterase
MNWLAHLYLSEPDAAFRIGNLLPDMVSREVLAALPDACRRGVIRHRHIDAWTDSHPLVRSGFPRFQPPVRRFAGILTDVFFDHFLSVDWLRFSPVPLPEFIAEVYGCFESHRHLVPFEAQPILERMRQEDWLGSYGSLEGIRLTLRRMSRRLRRPVDLADAMPILETHYEAFHSDFHGFFPQLCRVVTSQPSCPQAA